MSGRKNFFTHKVADAQSLASSFVTDPVKLETVSLVGYNISTADVTNNVGEFGIQHRMWIDANTYSAWNDLTLDSDSILADADATLEIIASKLPPGELRLKYSALDAQVQTLTFPTKAASADGDYIVITDKNGDEWAFAMDKTGAAAATPTGAAWTAIPSARKVYYDISGGGTAASVAALAETALNALTGFSSVFTTDDSAANGTMTLSATAAGYGVAPVGYSKDDSGAGSITGVITSGPDGTAAIFVSGSQE